MYAFMSVCTQICMSACIYICIYVCMDKWMIAYICINEDIHISCMHVDKYIERNV